MQRFVFNTSKWIFILYSTLMVLQLSHPETLFAANATSGLSARELHCEYQEGPLANDASHPRLSGMVADSRQKPASASKGLTYPVADFKIERSVIVNEIPVGYRHTADISFFKGRYIATWAANTVAKEAAPGQIIYMSHSNDFIKWSDPVAVFTSKGGAVNPVDHDYQWQPDFINYKDSVLFCAWSISGVNGATYVSRSLDGIKWENIRINAPLPKTFNNKIFAEGTDTQSPTNKDFLENSPSVGFPTNHGLITKRGVMLFPIGLIPNVLQVCALISKDAGRTWEFGECTDFIPIAKFLKPSAKNKNNDKYIKVWEPHFFEHPDGKIGVLLNVVSQNTALTSDQTIFYAGSSDGGYSFSSPEPVDLETISSRHISFSMKRSPSDLILVANDWLKKYSPELRDRHYLSAYFSPVCDPDLLIPGPVIQPHGNRAFYPNGEINKGEMIIAYTYGGGIYASRVKKLPDFSTPFFLKRESRPEVIIDKKLQTAYFPETFSSLGLVLTEKLIKQVKINLEFTLEIHSVPFFYQGMSDDEAVNSLQLLTIGAEDHNNAGIRVVRPMPPYHLEILRNNKWVKIAEVGLFEPLHFKVSISGDSYSIKFNDQDEITCEGTLKRKINFGGFYIDPIAYPSTGTFQLDLKSVKVY